MEKKFESIKAKRFLAYYFDSFDDIFDIAVEQFHMPDKLVILVLDHVSKRNIEDYQGQIQYAVELIATLIDEEEKNGGGTHDLAK